jgi:hypothetical protein
MLQIPLLHIHPQNIFPYSFLPDAGAQEETGEKK